MKQLQRHPSKSLTLPWESRWGCWPKTPPCPGGDWRGAWCSDDVHGEKKRSEARKHENLTDGVPHAPSPSDDRNPTSPTAALSVLLHRACKVTPRKFSSAGWRWEVNLRKELAGGDISPEILQQQARNFTVHRRFKGVLPQAFYKNVVRVGDQWLTHHRAR